MLDRHYTGITYLKRPQVASNGSSYCPTHVQFGTPDSRTNLRISGLAPLLFWTGISEFSTNDSSLKTGGNISRKGAKAQSYHSTWPTRFDGHDIDSGKIKVGVYSGCFDCSELIVLCAL